MTAGMHLVENSGPKHANVLSLANSYHLCEPPSFHNTHLPRQGYAGLLEFKF